MSEEQGDPPDGGPPGGGFLLHGPFGAWPEETARRDRLQGLIRRQGRQLFHIAFWLTGSVEEAERRSQDALQRLLGEAAETPPAAGTPLPDGGAPPQSGEASSDLEAEARRGRRLVLVGWRRGRGFGRGRSGRGQRGATAPALHAALARLDPDLRAALVLRVGMGLEEGEAASLLSTDGEALRDRLARARGRIASHLGASASGAARLTREEEDALSDYLDDRLDPARHAAFDRRLQKDRRLREAVELHRGLTLEFHEEAPSLPRGYEERALDRLEESPPGASPGGGWRPPAAVLWVAGGAVVTITALLFLVPWRAPASSARGGPAAPGGGAEGATPPAAAAPSPDAETIRALQSLGYLAGSRPTPRPASPSASPQTTPAAPVGPAGGGTAATLPFRVVPLPIAPALGLDHEVIRSAEDWQARFPGGAAPAVDFSAEMVILLRDALGNMPPSRLRVAAVSARAGRIRIECRIDRPASGGVPAPAGQAVVLPSDDRPIQIVMP